MKNYALISVSNKEGLESLARALVDQGLSLLATGGTYDFLRTLGFEVGSVSEFTGEPERFGGRIKTLHHKIFGSLLMRDEKDFQEWPYQSRISVLVVNFYPFIERASLSPIFSDMIELIDIGGPALVRAAAKNFENVTVLTHPKQYARWIATPESEREALRKRFALDAFRAVEELDQAIVKDWSRRILPGSRLKYGENPHQEADFQSHGTGSFDPLFVTRGEGSFSYNNFRDAEVVLRFLRLFPEGPAACVVKHQTLCGAAAGLPDASPEDIFEGAWEGDPVSRYGGVLGFNYIPSEVVLNQIEKRFFEVFVLPWNAQESASVRKFCEKKKSLKVLFFRPEIFKRVKKESWSGLIGFFEQDLDSPQEKVELKSLEALKVYFGEWTAALSKSNAMVLVAPWKKKGWVLAGAGQGQPNRVDALKRLAIPRAQDFSQRLGIPLSQMSCFSDAFLPFPDSIDLLKEAGIPEIYHPGGSKADALVLERAHELGIVVHIRGQRHFFH